jgi:fimbrial chaperone protein
MIGDERTATITVTNPSDAPTNVQIRTLDWSQPDGGDSYVASAVLMVSPPAATLGPGESQVIRLVVDNLPEVHAERSFRLMIDQIPREGPSQGAGVRTAIRALVPVFLSPSATGKPNLSWRAGMDDGTLRITATNGGSSREKLIDLRIFVDGHEVTTSPLAGYVLTGATRAWTVSDVPASARMVKVTAEGDWGEVEVDVPIAP